jgi:DNA-binding XRE family transcriptional regulator
LRKFRPYLVVARRRRMGKTQQRLSEEVGISQTSMSALEKGRKQPRTDTLVRLSHALECKIDAFFD